MSTNAVAVPEGVSAPVVVSVRPRLTSKGYVSWIYARPRVDEHFIGYIRNGSSVLLRSTERVSGVACREGFYAVEPRGFVCANHTVTLEPSSRFLNTVVAAAAVPGPLPYRYAFSDGAPMYNRVPSLDEQRRREQGFGPAGDKRPAKKKYISSYEDRASLEAILPDGPMPAFLAHGGMAAEGRRGLVHATLPPGSMLAFTRAFEVDGRTWLLSADQALVPADRVRLFQPSTFRGTPLGQGVELPMAWMRRAARPHVRLSSGGLEPTGAPWSAKHWVRLTGAFVDEGRTRYLETLDRDPAGASLYVAENDATVVEAVQRLATGVKPGQKWILVRIQQGTLVAYEGLTPVYATLMSPGRGGVPIEGHDHVQDSTTPLGTYFVTFKDKAATMSPDKPGAPRTQWISDVPHIQYFNPPFALHAAYWHDRFGEPTSAGCVNVSPIDAEVLFQWSDPPVPDGWQGVTGATAPVNGPTTAIVVRR